MTDNDLDALVRAATAAVGRERVFEELSALANRGNHRDTLTVVANAGVHTIPPQYLRGEVYEVSRGNWTGSDQAEVTQELIRLLSGLARKLRAHPWQTVYLVPTGHPILTINVKLLVYRLLRLNTIDLYYREGIYLEIQLDHRRISLDLESTDGDDGA